MGSAAGTRTRCAGPALRPHQGEGLHAFARLEQVARRRSARPAADIRPRRVGPSANFAPPAGHRQRSEIAVDAGHFEIEQRHPVAQAPLGRACAGSAAEMRGASDDWLKKRRAPQPLKGLKPQIIRQPSAHSTRSASRSTAYGSSTSSRVCGSKIASMESEANGSEVERRAQRHPGPELRGQQRRVLGASAAPADAARGPRRPTCSSSKPNTSSSASRASAALFAQHARAEGAVEPLRRRVVRRCFQSSLLAKTLAKIQCYRLNTPQNVNPSTPPRSAARSRIHRQLYLAHRLAARTGRLVAVDPGDAAPVMAELERSGASLAAILLTHHHPDHIGGVAELLRRGPVPVIGPDDARIPCGPRTVRDGERCELPELGLGFDILHVPGHTLSHIAFCGHGALFCGDTLFSAGCGRMFEGTPTQMNCFARTGCARLPPETRCIAATNTPRPICVSP